MFTLITAAAFGLLSNFSLRTERIPDQSLFDTKWSLKKIHTTEGTEEVFTKAFIKFHEEKKSAGGNGGCNSFGSTFTREGQAIRFTGIFSTKMYCEGVQATEDVFFKQLAKVNRFTISGKNLWLYRDKELLLEFKAE